MAASNGSPVGQGSGAKADSDYVAKLDARDLALHAELKKVLAGLAEMAKKVKAEGVKDMIEKVTGLFGMLEENRLKRRAYNKRAVDMLAPAVVTRELESLRGYVAATVKESQDSIIGALKDSMSNFTSSGPSPQTDVVAMKSDIIEAITEMRTHVAQSKEPSWTEVVKRRSTILESTPKPPVKLKSASLKRTVSRARTPAILVDVSEKDFPELAKKIRRGVNTDVIGDHIVGMRQAKSGGILFEVRGGQDQVEKVRAEISRSVGEKIVVRPLLQKDVLEIRDLDEWTTKEEIAEAIIRDTAAAVNGISVLSLRRQYGGQQAAIVSVPRSVASALLKAERLRVGMVCCRVRAAEPRMRCFRCLAFGHKSSDCKGPDRSNCCRRCGEGDHKAGDCTASKDKAKEFVTSLVGVDLRQADSASETKAGKGGAGDRNNQESK